MGTETVDGRRTIEFTGGPWRSDQLRPNGSDPHDVGGETLYLDAKTHLPYKFIVSRDGETDSIIYTEFKRLPITPANELLLSLKKQFPGARVVHNHKAYLSATGGATTYTGQ